MRKRVFLSLILVALARGQVSIPWLVRAAREEVSPDQAMEDMRRIWATDRWFTFPKFQETAESVAAMMRRAGLENIQILNAPADGVSQFGYWTMPLAWDVRQATL